MPLDFDLINRSIPFVISRIENGHEIAPGLIALSDLLDNQLLTKLQEYSFKENTGWKSQENHQMSGYNHHRKKINWLPDSIIEETHIVFDGLTDHLNQLFKRQNKFLGLSVWKDDGSFQIAPHTDNPVIDIAIQIYLNGDDNKDLGTKFQLDTVVTIPYKTNHGYLMDNRQNIRHFYDGKAPEDYYRYSLYAIWANANK
jgi:hypothetical protein